MAFFDRARERGLTATEVDVVQRGASESIAPAPSLATDPKRARVHPWVLRLSRSNVSLSSSQNPHMPRSRGCVGFSSGFTFRSLMRFFDRCGSRLPTKREKGVASKTSSTELSSSSTTMIFGFLFFFFRLAIGIWPFGNVPSAQSSRRERDVPARREAVVRAGHDR